MSKNERGQEESFIQQAQNHVDKFINRDYVERILVTPGEGSISYPLLSENNLVKISFNLQHLILNALPKKEGFFLASQYLDPIQTCIAGMSVSTLQDIPVSFPDTFSLAIRVERSDPDGKPIVRGFYNFSCEYLPQNITKRRPTEILTVLGSDQEGYKFFCENLEKTLIANSWENDMRTDSSDLLQTAFPNNLPDQGTGPFEATIYYRNTRLQYPVIEDIFEGISNKADTKNGYLTIPSSYTPYEHILILPVQSLDQRTGQVDIKALWATVLDLTPIDHVRIEPGRMLILGKPEVYFPSRAHLAFGKELIYPEDTDKKRVLHENKIYKTIASHFLGI